MILGGADVSFLCFVLGTTRFRADLSCFFVLRILFSLSMLLSLLEGRKGGREVVQCREDDLECT